MKDEKETNFELLERLEDPSLPLISIGQEIELKSSMTHKTSPTSIYLCEQRPTNILILFANNGLEYTLTTKQADFVTPQLQTCNKKTMA